MVVTAGQLIGGRYRVEYALGQGAMGQLVAARNVELDQLVAIKLLHTDVALNGVMSEQRRLRLVREARVAAKIRSAHVVRTFDVVSSSPDGPFIVMELLEGEDLGERLVRCGKLSVSEVLEVVSQIGEAIGEAHALGIVHRDIKPRNVFCVRLPGGAPFYKLLDLGIAQIKAPEWETLTSAEQLLGSPAYAAPEQLRAAHGVTPAADIWALGVLMYECLTGVRPFVADTLGQLCIQIVESHPAAPSQHDPSLPRELDDLILRCLSKSAEGRFASVEQLLHACARLAPAASARAVAYLSGLRLGAGGHPTLPVQRRQLTAPALSETNTAEPASVRIAAVPSGQRRRAVSLLVTFSAVAALLSFVQWRIERLRSSPPEALSTADATPAGSAGAAAASLASPPPSATPGVSAVVPEKQAPPAQRPARGVASAKPARAATAQSLRSPPAASTTIASPDKPQPQRWVETR